jgi:hypothetical protein
MNEELELYTKEQLLEKNKNLEAEIERLGGESIAIRKEFAKAFGWTKQGKMYYESVEYITPSWYKVFTKIGELLTNANRLSDEYRINGIEHRLTQLEAPLTNNQ